MEYTIDTASLKGYQAKRGLSNIEFARRLGIHRNTLTLYYENPKKMPYGVIDKMIRVLELTNEEATDVFFNKKLA